MIKITVESGLGAAILGCVTGAALVIYTNKQCKKEKDEMDRIMKEVKDSMDELNRLLDDM